MTQTHADRARDLARRARAALDHGHHENAVALADVAAVYALLADTTADGARPAPRTPAPSPAPDTDDQAPALLVRAHHAVQAAGGRMLAADLAATLGTDSRRLGIDLGTLLRAVGVDRPGQGTMRFGPGPARAGYLADALDRHRARPAPTQP
ncbi:hypothetical protein OG196_44110 (plasmid) [Kitasatospora purpeofusca]|uniref:hypothetical protein n=1 Tax=Kitasatospora purpeofusca TaxID=67352 RepID=UPI002E1581B3|nr:hypothetical protein OG196_44110 [Kitasatospora purpeofusca]